MKVGRPTKYDESFIQKVDEYLKLRKDEEVKIVRQRNDDKGYEMYDNKLKVRLPTIEGFAYFINVGRRVLYMWEKDYPEFMHALGKIRTEQKERLINMGLSGDYNSTIAKLVLSANHGMREGHDVTTDGEKILSINYIKPKQDGDNPKAND